MKDTECEICLYRIFAVASCLGYIYLTQAILRKAPLVSTYMVVLFLHSPPCWRITFKRHWLTDRSFRSVDADPYWHKLPRHAAFAMLLFMGYSDESPAGTTQCDFRCACDVAFGIGLWHPTTFGSWTMKEGASAQRLVNRCNKRRNKGLETALHSASQTKR